MAFTNRPTVALTLEQVLEAVDQLAPADKLKVAKRLRGKVREDIVEELIDIFSKVKMSQREVTALVEEVRAERYASKKTSSARR